MRHRVWLVGLLVIAAQGVVAAQDRDTKVRSDRESFEESLDWIYNDLDQGIRAAEEQGKPLMVVFRCIPCEACQEFDDDVARRDPIIREMLDQFVCVRIVQANDIDLTRFQFDFDQSFAVILMNADQTIYGRFGTRSERYETEDISLEGLRQAMESALAMHREIDSIRPALAGKQVRQARYETPRDYPSLAGKYGSTIDYEGQVARSCMHCHQVGEAERLVYRSGGEAIPDEVLFPYPDPAVLGLKLDPTEKATVEQVVAGSIAEEAGVRVGDAIEEAGGQPLLSIADLQWVLHNAPATVELPIRVMRDGQSEELTLELAEGWRRGNIAWRATSWDLRRMGLGGMFLEDLTDEGRREAGLPEDGMALRIRHLGEFGDHAVAKRAGVQPGDIVVGFDGQTARMSESELLAYAVQQKRPGDTVTVTVLRDGHTHRLEFALQ